MQSSIWKLSVLLILLNLPIAQAGSILVRVDEKGRKVFYNIPPPNIFSTSSATPIYYSPRLDEYLELVEGVCTRYGMDLELVKAVIQVESNYEPRAVSPKGARGLMQLMPATAARYGVKKIFDPKQNVEGGVRYLKDLLELFDSNLELTLAAYNAGENVVQRVNGIPNYTETQNYVRKVLALYNGESSYLPFSGSGKPRLVTYYKYVDEKGVTHYTAAPVPGVELTKVSFYY